MKYLFYMFLFLVIISCGDGKEKQNGKGLSNVVEIDIRQLPVKNLFSYKRPIDNCRFVPLETTDESLIGEIDKVCVEGDLIFVKDDKKNLFTFSMSGKFLNKIGSVGQGGEELISFVDFYVNKEKGYVGIFDVLKSKMLRFSFDGKYISSHSCAEEMNESYNIVGIIGDDLLLGMRNNKDSQYAYITVSENDYSITGSYLPYPVIGSVSSTPMRSIAGYSTHGFYVTAQFSDSVYQFSDKNIAEPILTVRSDLKVVNPKLLSELNAIDLETDFDAGPILRDRGFSVGLSSIYVAGTFLNVHYPLPNYQSADIFYSIKRGKAYRSTANRSDFFGQGWGPALTTTDEEIVYGMEADRIIELKDEADLFVNKEVLEPIKDVEEFDNPVLVFFSSGFDFADDD